MNFIANNIQDDSLSPGELLRRHRQKKKLSLTQVSKEVGIKESYLEAIEADKIDMLPRGVYVKSFISRYAEFLELDTKDIFPSVKIKTQDKPKQKSLFVKQVVKSKYFWSMPKLAKSVLLATIVGLGFFYLLLSFKSITSSPRLDIFYPNDNLIISKKDIEIKGNVNPGIKVVINGENVLTDLDGDFSKNINLKNGINIVQIAAKKAYGRDTVVNRQILVK